MQSWSQSTKNTKGRVVLRGDIVKHDSGAYAVFTEQGGTQERAEILDSNILLKYICLPDILFVCNPNFHGQETMSFLPNQRV